MPENDTAEAIKEALAPIPDLEASKKRKYEKIIDNENVTVEMNIEQADKALEEEYE